MFRQIATVIDPADVIGIVGLAFIATCAYLFDPRLALGVIGAFLILLAVALGTGRREAPAEPAESPAPPAGE